MALYYATSLLTVELEREAATRHGSTARAGGPNARTKRSRVFAKMSHELRTP
jgi:hypothetical protein